MKKIILPILISLLLTSCGKSIEEEMFYDFINDRTIEAINMSIDDLDFKIVSLEKTGEILAKDSISDYSESIIVLSKSLNSSNDKIAKTLKDIKANNQEIKKAIKNKSIKSKINKSYGPLYQEKIDNLKEIIGLYEEQLKSEENISKELQSLLEKIKSRLDLFNNQPEKLLGSKYEVTYSMYMPDTKLTNTFKGLAFTNPDNTQFIGLTE
tara:strand:- start:129 stop:758 length:630 start_codon:yes stop_codon:yes gene_type:complete